MSKFEGKVWEGVFGSFAEAAATGAGFAGATWLERSLVQAQQDLADYKSALDSGRVPAVRRKTHLPELVDSVAAGSEPVRIVDFGGGMGLVYLAVKSGTGAQLDYTIIDLPELCEKAAPLFQEFADLRFVSSIEDAGEASPDILYANSSLQYVDDWESLLENFAAISPTTILLDEAYVGDFDTFVSRQAYYDSRIPHRFFNRDELVGKFAKLGYSLAASKQYAIEILGERGELPMGNFPEAYRLNYVSSLKFERNDKVKRQGSFRAASAW